MFLFAFFILLIHLHQQTNTSAKTHKNYITKHSLVEVIPHDSDCYTQGLAYSDGFLYESCGINGKSSVREVDPLSGQVIRMIKLSDDIFAEGLVVIGDIIYVLTWMNKFMIVLDRKTMTLMGKYSYRTYSGEGWGLTYDGKQFIVSDGSSRLSFFDVPDISKLSRGGFFHYQLIKTREVIVRDSAKKEIVSINELEWVGDDHIYANVWYKDFILKINVIDGSISEHLDLYHLYPYKSRTKTADCLNGIALNETDNTLLLTGKLWPHYYKIKVVQMDAVIHSKSGVQKSNRLINNSKTDGVDL